VGGTGVDLAQPGRGSYAPVRAIGTVRLNRFMHGRTNVLPACVFFKQKPRHKNVKHHLNNLSRRYGQTGSNRGAIGVLKPKQAPRTKNQRDRLISEKEGQSAFSQECKDFLAVIAPVSGAVFGQECKVFTLSLTHALCVRAARGRRGAISSVKVCKGL
jgi:hypothetical protein